MVNKIVNSLKNFFHLRLGQIFFCAFLTLFVTFFVLGSFCGHYLRNIHTTIDEKSQTEKYLQSTVNKMEFQILDLMYAVSLYLDLGSEAKKKQLVHAEREFIKTVHRYEQDQWVQSQKKDTEELVVLSERIHKKVETLVSLQSEVNTSFIEVNRYVDEIRMALREEKSKTLTSESHYAAKLKLVLRLETYVESIGSLVAHNLIEANKGFYQGIYDLERDYRSIFQAEEGAHKRFSLQGIKKISAGFDSLIEMSYKLVKLRESKKVLLEQFRQDTEEVVALLRDRIVMMLVEKNQYMQESINRILLRLFFVFFVLIFVTFLLGCFFYIFLMRLVGKPLVKLTEDIKEVARLGDYSKATILSHRGCVEVKDLMDSFQEMIVTIQDKENLLANSIMNMEDAFVLTQILPDKNQLYLVDCNASAEQMLGISKEEVMGHNISEVLPWFQDQGLVERAWIVYHSGHASVLHKVPLQEVGEEKYVELTIYRVQDGVAFMCRNITDRLLMEKELVHSGKLAAVGEMAAGVAHEIGNPLTAVSSIVQILKKQETDRVKLQDLTIVYENIQRIQETLKEVDGFSRRPKDEVRTFLLHEVLDAVFHLLKYHKKVKNLQLTIHKGDLDVSISADPQKMEQVFLNIILNAADAVLEKLQREESYQGTIDIYTEEKEKKVCVRIVDNGAGLDCREVKKVFEPFFSTKQKVEGSGTGLGMTIVKNTVESYGGDIHIFSEKNVGTTVELRFPLVD